MRQRSGLGLAYLLLKDDFSPEIDLQESWIWDIYKGTIHPTNEDCGDLVKLVKTLLISTITTIYTTYSKTLCSTHQ